MAKRIWSRIFGIFRRADRSSEEFAALLQLEADRQEAKDRWLRDEARQSRYVAGGGGVYAGLYFGVAGDSPLSRLALASFDPPFTTESSERSCLRIGRRIWNSDEIQNDSRALHSAPTSAAHNRTRGVRHEER